METATEYPPAQVFSNTFLIDAKETVIKADAAVTLTIREALLHAGGIVFENVIAPGLLDSLTRLAQAADYRQTDLKEFGLRGCDLAQHSGLPFCAILARTSFLQWLEQIADCPPIHHIEGHLAQMLPGNAVEWHRDSGHGIRRLAMVLNLTSEPYEGGRFELRRKSDGTPLLAYQANSRGSLAVFRIGNDLQHRVTGLTAGGPRNTFSAWARGSWVEEDRTRHLRLGTWPPLVPLSPSPVAPGN